MIEVRNMDFSYEKSKSFIKDLNLKIEKEKITTIIGPNGSGKSTLLGVLCGLNKASRGDILIGDLNIKNLKQRDIAKIVATVHQQNSVPSDITVEDLISYGRIPHKSYLKRNSREDEAIVKWAMERTGVYKYKDSKVMDLSGGERQRVFIAMALSQKPKILFLDEPTTYLDIFHQIEILEIIKELNEQEKLTVIMVLHDINQAIKYSHNIVVMKNGELIKNGSVSKVINKDLIRETYNVDGILEKNSTLEETYFIPLSIS